MILESSLDQFGGVFRVIVLLKHSLLQRNSQIYFRVGAGIISTYCFVSILPSTSVSIPTPCSPISSYFLLHTSLWGVLFCLMFCFTLLFVMWNVQKWCANANWSESEGLVSKRSWYSNWTSFTLVARFYNHWKWYREVSAARGEWVSLRWSYGVNGQGTEKMGKMGIKVRAGYMEFWK